MSKSNFILLCVFVVRSLNAQTPPQSLQLQTPAPASPTISANVVGNTGNANYVYYVIANYTGGSATSQPVTVVQAPVTLSGSNFINIGWNALTGVSTYDVVRLPLGQTFTGSCTCAVTTGLTVTSTTDTGGALGSYTRGAVAPAANGTFYINNTQYSPPQMRQIVNGVDSAVGSGSSAGPAVQVNGSATGLGTTANFNSTTPVAGTNGRNCTFQVSTTNISCYVPAASGISPGVVEPDGTIITVFSGIITVATATSAAKGVVQGDGSTLTITAGTIKCTTATSSQIGCAKPDGTILTISAGAETVAKASSSAFGVVEVDNTTITASAGVISAVTSAAATCTASQMTTTITFTIANAANDGSVVCPVTPTQTSTTTTISGSIPTNFTINVKVTTGGTVYTLAQPTGFNVWSNNYAPNSTSSLWYSTGDGGTTWDQSGATNAGYMQCPLSTTPGTTPSGTNPVWTWCISAGGLQVLTPTGTYGTVENLAAVSHNFLTSVVAGVPVAAQPAVGDISGFGSNVATFLATPSGANFNAMIAAGGVPVAQNPQSGAYTTVLADGGKEILHPSTDNNARTFTIDSNANVAYPIGTVINFTNEVNTLTIAITSDTLQLAGTATTGSRTLAAGGTATAKKEGTTLWYISGPGLT